MKKSIPYLVILSSLSLLLTSCSYYIPQGGPGPIIRDTSSKEKTDDPVNDDQEKKNVALKADDSDFENKNDDVVKDDETIKNDEITDSNVDSKDEQKDTDDEKDETGSPVSPIVNQTVSFKVFSDLDLMPRYFIGDTNDFWKQNRSDRKLLVESESLLKEKFRQVALEAPDVLVLEGSLTAAGEKESHNLLAKMTQDYLTEARKKNPNAMVMILPGSIDINNIDAVRYTPTSVTSMDDGNYVQPDKNFGKVKVDSVTPREFYDIYQPVIENVPANSNITVERYKGSKEYNLANWNAILGQGDFKYGGYQGYSIRIPGKDGKKGTVLISIDSNSYTEDNAIDKDPFIPGNYRTTGGKIAAGEMNWIRRTALEATANGDAVIAFMHHGVVPHFTEEPNYLADYLVDDYEHVASNFANWGIHYVFSGHMHSNDIASYTNSRGNKIYDIETGSLATYPVWGRNVVAKVEEKDGKSNLSLDIDKDTFLPGKQTQIVYRKLDNTGNDTIDGDQITPHAQAQGLEPSMAQPMTSLIRDKVIEYMGGQSVEGFIGSLSERYIKTRIGVVQIETILRDFLTNQMSFGGQLTVQHADFRGYQYYPSGLQSTKTYQFILQAGGIFGDVHLFIDEPGMQTILRNVMQEISNKVINDISVWNKLATDIQNQLLSTNAWQGHNFLDIINAIYQSNLAGDEAASLPDWARSAMEDINKMENSQILFGANGFFRIVANNFANWLFDFIGNISISFDSVKSLIHTENFWWGAGNFFNAIKPIWDGRFNPINGSRSTFVSFINTSMNSTLNKAVTLQTGLFYNLASIMQKVGNSMANDDNEKEDIKTTLSMEM